MRPRLLALALSLAIAASPAAYAEGGRGAELTEAQSNSGPAWKRLLETVGSIQKDLTEESPKAAPNQIAVDDSDDLPGFDD